jgi:hypothetical protein
MGMRKDQKRTCGGGSGGMDYLLSLDWYDGRRMSGSLVGQ